MNRLFLYLVISLFWTSAYSQDFIYQKQDCGEWVVDSTYIEGWVTIDTINTDRKVNNEWTVDDHTDGTWTTDDWVYSEWQYGMNPARNYAMYCPCGCGYDDWAIRKRVNSIGIIQKQKKVTTYKYIQSDFMKRVNQLINK